MEQRFKLGPLSPFNHLAALQVCTHPDLQSHSRKTQQEEGEDEQANLHVSTWTNNPVLHLQRSSGEAEAPPLILATKIKNHSQLSL